MLPQQVFLVHCVILLNRLDVLEHHDLLGEAGFGCFGGLLLRHGPTHFLIGSRRSQVCRLVLGKPWQVIVAGCIKALIHE